MPATEKNKKRNLGITISNDSTSLTSLLIIRPYGVTSKNLSSVRINAWNVLLNIFLAADAVYIYKQLAYIR